MAHVSAESTTPTPRRSRRNSWLIKGTIAAVLVLLIVDCSRKDRKDPDEQSSTTTQIVDGDQSAPPRAARASATARVAQGPLGTICPQSRWGEWTTCRDTEGTDWIFSEFPEDVDPDDVMACWKRFSGRVLLLGMDGAESVFDRDSPPSGPVQAFRLIPDTKRTVAYRNWTSCGRQAPSEEPPGKNEPAPIPPVKMAAATT